MHAAAFSPRGGVAHKTTRLRGQSIIEYVLIAAVIGLVVVFAGPQVSGAIRNQFNQVANTVDSGTDGDSFMSAEEKAYREAMKTVVNKDAKDWTLDEQKAAATDIAKNGTSSPVYAKAKAAMDAETEWSLKLTNGKTMLYCIIGINHDELADGSGKAGLTFLTVHTDGNGMRSRGLGSARLNTTNTNAGGWEQSELRQKMNSGEIWNLLPAAFQSKVKPVIKLTNNVDGLSKDAPVTATVDKLFLLSRSEITETLNNKWSDYAWIGTEGVQYEGLKGSVNGDKVMWTWTRSAMPGISSGYVAQDYGHLNSGEVSSKEHSVYSAFCF